MTWRQLIGAIFVFFLVLVALAFSTHRFTPGKRDAALEELETLKVQYLAKQRILLNMGAYRKQKQEMERRVAAARAQLPDDFDRTFAAVRSSAKARELRLGVLAPAKDEWKRDVDARISARIVVTGRYHEVGALIADVSRLPSSTIISPFVIERSSQPGMVTLKGVVHAFRPLKEEEFIAKRKEAAEKSKAEAAKR